MISPPRTIVSPSMTDTVVCTACWVNAVANWPLPRRDQRVLRSDDRRLDPHQDPPVRTDPRGDRQRRADLLLADLRLERAELGELPAGHVRVQAADVHRADLVVERP